MITLNKCVFHQEAIDAAVKVMKSGWPGLGTEVAEFEKEFSQFLGARYSVAANSGTEALRLAVSALGHPRTIAISTPNTFVSTNHVLLQQGMRVAFADIDPDTGSMDVESCKRMLQKCNAHGTVGLIMLVHFAGMPADLEEFRELSKWYKVPLIEDCAHATGAIYRKKPIGGDAFAACFSFHAVKNLPIGDGGMFVTKDKTLYERSIRMRWLGIDKSTAERTTSKFYSWEYEVPLIGYKSHMNDLMAAIGRAQLRHVTADNKYRETIVHTYLDEMPKSVKVMDRPKDRQSSNHLFVIRSEKRDAIMKALTANEIQFGHHYKPNYKYDVYVGSTQDGSMPGMEEYERTALTLPCHLALTLQDVHKIVDVIKEVA